jgi:hypothetical protein
MNQKNFGIVGSSKDEFLQTDDCIQLKCKYNVFVLKK